MNFSEALEKIKEGDRVSRQNWNGRGMFIFLVPGSQFKVEKGRPLGIYGDFEYGTLIDYCPHIDMFTADKKVVPWLASQTDLLAEDWQEGAS